MKVTIALVLVMCIIACDSDRAAQSKLDVQAERRVRIGVEYPHILYTHCGIDDTRFNRRNWEAHPPPGLRGPNPPPGWDNHTVNTAEGTMVLINPNLARFTNTATGEQVDFTPMPRGKELSLCW